MSGIVGIFHRDGVPIEPALLHCLVDSLAYRGPDAHGSWLETSIGLGHSMLCGPRASRLASCSPLFLRTVIGSPQTLGSTGAQNCRLHLIFREVASVTRCRLRANFRGLTKWGPACVEHLRGDFSFAVWDAPNKQLFCARDQFGVNPQHASIGSTLVFSNTLDCIRRHPAVSGDRMISRSPISSSST